MRFKEYPLAAVSVLIIGLALGVGCGGGDEGPGTGLPPACSITNVRTDLLGPWQTGETFNIRWDAQGSSPVRIELLKAGAVVATVAASTVNDGFHPWSVALGALSSGSDYGIRVTATDDAGCGDEMAGLAFLNVAGCNFTFTVSPDTITSGDAFTILWTSTNTTGKYDLELWAFPFSSASELVGLLASDLDDTGSYLWDPIDSFNFGTYDFYRLKVGDPNVDGCEELSPLFRLVDPDICTIELTGISQNDIFNNGQPIQFDMAQTQGSGFVNLVLYAGGELVPGGFIASNVAVGLDFNWTVTDFGHTGMPDRYRIKVTDANDSYCIGFSDRFTIQ